MLAKRIGSFLLDYFITAVIFEYIMFEFILKYIFSMSAENVQINDVQILVRLLIGIYIAVLYMILRDVPKNGSIGKHAAGLTIIDSKTKEPAKLWKRILRNIFWLFGPLEIVVSLCSGKMIGDWIFKTELDIKKK